MSALGTAFAGAGFVRSLISSIMVQRTRQIIWPLVDGTGAPVQVLKQGITAGANSSQVVGQAATIIGGYVAILEEHKDELEITRHPVEQGSVISDHAFKSPISLTMQMGWSPSSLGSSGLPNLLGILPLPSLAGFFGSGNNSLINSVYQQFLSLQAQRALVTVYTGKRILPNMLPKLVVERTTEATENALVLTVNFEEIIIANVKSVQVPTNPSAQAAPQDTTPSVPQGQQSLQPAQAFNAPTVST